MIITFNNNPIKIPDEEIDLAMKKLDLSTHEAVEMWLDDHGYTVNIEQIELNKKAQKIRAQHDAVAEKEKKPRKPREKKENPTKKAIIKAIYNGIVQNLYDFENISITNDEKYIDFSVDNVKYTVNLVAHREKKEKK